jgi:hypothetical protein
MTQMASSIASIIRDLAVEGQNASMITIGMSTDEVADFEVKQAYETLSGADDLPHTLRATIGVVVAPLEYLSRKRAEQLLSRLRDVHCNKVLLFDSGCEWSREELRALGYLEVDRPLNDGRCYIFDPDAFNEAREWNNPTDWANPQNFRKYRW